LITDWRLLAVVVATGCARRNAETKTSFFCRVGSIHAASSSLGILGKQDALSAGPDFLGAVGTFSMPPHINEPILTVAAERTSQLLPNTLYISKTQNISYRRTKETFTTFFRRTKLFSLIRHAWMSITFALTGRFSIGEYPRRKDAPYLILIIAASIDKKLRKKKRNRICDSHISLRIDIELST
jgi:hypothetical protein